jgi:integrase
MKNVTKLTKKKVDSFSYQGGWDIRWDSELTGFGVRLYPSNKKSYIFSYRFAGRKKLIALGSTYKITLDEARNLAKLKAAKVITGDEKHSHLANENFAKFCTLYMERHARKHKKTWQADQRRIDKNLLPKLAHISMKAITKADVMTLHSKLGKTAPYEANRTLSLLSTLFEFAKKWGYLEEAHPSPTKYIQRFKEEKRDRWISKEEIPALMTAIDNESNLYARMAILMYLFTGARKSELLTAKWADVDWDRTELRLKDTKAGRIHYIPLSTPAVDLLQKMIKIQDNPYIFPGNIKGKHLVNISKPWNRIKKQANLENVRLHDLRRTVGSWLAQAGNSLHLIGQILNHSNQSTTAIYARLTQNDAKNALEEHGQALKQLMTKS